LHLDASAEAALASYNADAGGCTQDEQYLEAYHKRWMSGFYSKQAYTGKHDFRARRFFSDNLSGGLCCATEEAQRGRLRAKWVLAQLPRFS